MHLIADIKSGKGEIYGRKGDRVTVYSTHHDPVYLVEHDKSKVKFSVDKKYLV